MVIGTSRRKLSLGIGAGALTALLAVSANRLFNGRTDQPIPTRICAVKAGAVPVVPLPLQRVDVPAAAFPLVAPPASGHLVDAQQRPFLIVGDASWSLLTQIDREDADFYLNDRESRGFNTLLVNLIEHRFSDHAPANFYGDSPFLNGEAFRDPNPKYFDYAEQILRNAASRGLLILLAPAYTGAGGGVDGWYGAMEASSPELLREYGRFVGRRFGSFSNIIWLHAGDYSPPNKGLIAAVARGILDVLKDSIHTVHNGPEVNGTEYWSNDQIPITIDTLYTYAPVADRALALSKRSKPFLLIESRYENAEAGTPLRTRIQAWQAVLSGAAGQIYGNELVWNFNASVSRARKAAWRAELGSPGALSMSHLSEFLWSIEWFNLRPEAELVDEGVLQGHYQAVAAVAKDRRTAVVYLPSSRQIGVDVSRLHGDQIQASWYDPATGEMVVAEGLRFLSPSRHLLKAPKCSRDGDWVLLLTSMA